MFGNANQPSQNKGGGLFANTALPSGATQSGLFNQKPSSFGPPVTKA